MPLHGAGCDAAPSMVFCSFENGGALAVSWHRSVAPPPPGPSLHGTFSENHRSCEKANTQLSSSFHSPILRSTASYCSAASFGPDPLEVEPPIESFPLVEAQPRHACTPIQSSFNGAIALVERGTCDFTTKVRTTPAAVAHRRGRCM